MEKKSQDTTTTTFSSSTTTYTSPFPSLPLPSPSLSLPSFLLSSPPPPSRPAFLSSSSPLSLSHSSLSSLISSISHSLLHSFSLLPSDIVLLLSPNSPLFPALSLGIISSGAILSTANPLLTPSELLSQLQDSPPSLILTTPSLLPKLPSSLPRPPILIKDFLNSLSHARTHECTRVGADPAALMYSSGTTGRSKGVICTHRNLIHISAVLRQVWGGKARDEVYLCVVPMFHMFGFSVFVCGAVAAGARVVVMEGGYTVEGVFEAVEKKGVTKIPAVPPMVVQMVKKREAAERYDLGTLREVVCSGAPLAREYVERFGECYPGVVLSQVRDDDVAT